MYKKLFNILKRHQKKHFFILLVFMVFGVLLEMIGVGLIIPVLTLFTSNDIAGKYPEIAPILNIFGNPSHNDLVIIALILLVSVYGLKNIYLGFLIKLQSTFAYNVQAACSQRLFEIYLRQPYSFHLQRNSADLIRNITTESTLFSSHALVPSMLIITEALVMIGLGSLVLFIEPISAITVGFFIGLVSWFFYFLNRQKVTKWGQERQYHEGKKIQNIQQGIGAAKDVKLLGKEREFITDFSVHNLNASLAARKQVIFQQYPRLGIEFLAISGLAILIISMLSTGRQINEIIPIIGFLAVTLFRLMPSLNRLISSNQTLRFSKPIINLIHDELKLENNISPPNKKENISLSFNESIEIENLYFKYDGLDTTSINNISINIKKGETVGFIGESGAGKSTLVDLILGLLKPTQGRIVIDNIDIHSDLRQWQNTLGYVPQSIFLLDDTLEKNIALGVCHSEIDYEALNLAIDLAQLRGFVNEQNDGLKVMVGERGVRLSGGQRQRIGIARALYHNPDVLVLDEATSALDNDTEKEVMSAIDALHGQKTILIVAHRLSTVENCDRIYRIQKGKAILATTSSNVEPNQNLVD
ncbi:ABC transporter ATP-binding protein [Methylophaga nitratireducenticrescens]|uniref:ABC transporter ATP-binding protein n=1 Tax=Methylophaga nitratireducenticrescens TaxID=754476 RepID=UPI000CDCB017|nr:ABC transporter ATP-binding protein [Methylophaga nitratireducenticrescens]AUZ84037.1 ATPase [Methylophaga nitratireducenticrescens]